MPGTHQHVGVRTRADHRADRRVDRDSFDVEQVDSGLGGDDLQRSVSEGQARREGDTDRLAGVRGSRHLDAAGAAGNVPAPATRRPASSIWSTASRTIRGASGWAPCCCSTMDTISACGDAVTGCLPDGEPDLAEPYRDLVDEDERLAVRRDAVEDAPLEQLLVVDAWRSARCELIGALPLRQQTRATASRASTSRPSSSDIKDRTRSSISPYVRRRTPPHRSMILLMNCRGSGSCASADACGISSSKASTRGTAVRVGALSVTWDPVEKDDPSDSSGHSMADPGRVRPATSAPHRRVDGARGADQTAGRRRRARSRRSRR